MLADLWRLSTYAIVCLPYISELCSAVQQANTHVLFHAAGASEAYDRYTQHMKEEQESFRQALESRIAQWRPPTALVMGLFGVCFLCPLCFPLVCLYALLTPL
jgi:hypothetical protein